MALWDGRFSGGPAEEMLRFSESLGTDLQMAAEDIAGSTAHVTMLASVGLLTEQEAQTICAGLQTVLRELSDGSFTPSIASEDIHMAVEERLGHHIGDLAGKLHTARSRNDQVATDVRLWLRTRLDALIEQLDGLVGALVTAVERDGQTLIPGFTHLQRGQPILLGHHLLAYAWSFRRDRDRAVDARARLNRCPLGAAAMAGTPHPIDRRQTAELLGFDAPTENAMDSVAARDHLLEALSVCAICATHLSRFAEELVLWSTSEFKLVTLPEAYTTGSSIMPQKRNPDAAELVRGKSALVIGALSGLLTLVKGLPMAYNRDLQEDRTLLFPAVETTLGCVGVTTRMVDGWAIHRDRFEAALRHDASLATEIADYLVRKGVPFREAHHVSGQMVRWCEEQGGGFEKLTPDALTRFHPALEADVLEWLNPREAIARRVSHGGTAWPEVLRQTALLREG